MSAEMILFILLAILAVVTAIAMLFSRNAVYAALFLITNFASVAIFYLILSAPFIALAQVTVYAGAIMVLFLFVIMLLGAEQTGRTPSSWWLQPLALVLGLILLGEALFRQAARHPRHLAIRRPSARYSSASTYCPSRSPRSCFLRL